MVTEREISIAEFQHSEQQEHFLNCKARYKALSGGFGSGKTVCNVLAGLQYAQEHPGSQGMWVSASYPLLMRSILVEWELWRRRIEEAVGQPLVADYNRANHRIELLNGSVIWMGTADKPDSLYGTTLAWIGADEIALWRREAWDIMLSRLRQPGFPAQAWATYTPYGKGWWTEVFEPDSPQRLHGSELFRISTGDNPAIGEEYLGYLRGRYSGKWALQYIDGFAQEFEGLVWPGLTGCETTDPLPEKWRRVVAGVDWGWTHPFVIELLGEDLQGQPWAFGEHYETMQSPEQMVAAALERQRVFNVETWYCDPSEPGNIAAFRRAGLNAVAADNAVIPGITSVASLIDRDLRVSDCPHLLRESYCWEQKRDGTFRQDKPRKEDDNGADSLRYATHSSGIGRPVAVQRARSVRRRGYEESYA